jgi:hypothetical protein
VTVKIYKSGPSLSVEDLAVLEQRLGRLVPARYRRFLLEHNGGRVWQDAFSLEDQPGTSVPRGFVWFFLGVDEEDPSCDLGKICERLGERIPPCLFPIAWTTHDDLICMASRGEDEGAIYLLVLDDTPTCQAAKAAVWHRLAPDLDTFLERLFFFIG